MIQKTTKIILALALIGLSATNRAYGATSYTLTGEGSNLTLTITGIGDMPDYTSYNDVPWYSQRTNIKTLVINDGVTSIGSYAFYGCRISSVEISNTVLSIRERAFAECGILTSINIPASVVSIGKYVFSSGDNLHTITGGDNVIQIGDHAFHTTRWLRNQPDGVVYFNKVLYCWKGAGEYMSENTVLNVAEGTVSIADYAFRFEHSANLTDIIFPSTLKYIGNYAFYQTGLKSITLPANLESIGEQSFSRCNSLATICSEAINAPTLGYGVFNLGYSSKTLYLKPNATGYESSKGWPNNQVKTFLLEENGLIYSILNIYAKTAQVQAGSNFNAVDLSLLKQIITYETNTFTVTTIAENAFKDNKTLTSLHIPDNITSIGEQAFFDCFNLATITGGNGLRTVGREAFHISRWAIDTLSTQYWYKNQPDGVVYIGSVLYRYKWDWKEGDEEPIAGSVSIDVKAGTLGIADDAFRGNDRYFEINPLISTVSLPNSLTHIGKNAFQECVNLTSVAIPENVKFIGSYAFASCNNLTSVYSEAKIAPLLESTNVFYIYGTPPARTLYLQNPAATGYDVSKGWFANQVRAALAFIVSM